MQRRARRRQEPEGQSAPDRRARGRAAQGRPAPAVRRDRRPRLHQFPRHQRRPGRAGRTSSPPTRARAPSGWPSRAGWWSTTAAPTWPSRCTWATCAPRSSAKRSSACSASAATRCWGDAHFGDWGFQMGLLITAIAEERPDLPYFGDGQGPWPAESPVSPGGPGADLSAGRRPRQGRHGLPRPRPQGHRRAAGRPRRLPRPVGPLRDRQPRGAGARLPRAGRATSTSGRARATPIRSSRRWSTDLKTKDLLVADQGALVVRVAREGDKERCTPLLVVSSEGSAMYGTTDLATILDRRQEHDPRADALRGRPAPGRPLRAGVPRRLPGRLRGRGLARAPGLRHHERARRQALQDPRRRRAQAERPDRDGPRQGARAPARGRPGQRAGPRPSSRPRRTRWRWRR